MRRSLRGKEPALSAAEGAGTGMHARQRPLRRLIVVAVPFPPSQRTRGRGTQSFALGKKIKPLDGSATRPAAKVGVPDYKNLAQKKLDTAEDLYRFMVDQFHQSRAFVLELMVVIILIIDLVYLFRG